MANQARPTPAVNSVTDLISELRRLEGALSPGNGVKWFVRLYRETTEAIALELKGGDLEDPVFMELLRAADRVVLEELRRAGLEREIWQAFAVLPAVRSVGVQGDERTYGHPIIIRAVTSEDAMTADFARIDWDVLERIAGRIVGDVPGINRVAYDITSKPPGTIEWE